MHLEADTRHLRRTVFQTPIVDPPLFDPPADVTGRERQLWEDLAPLAAAAGTLTVWTAFQFCRLIANLYLEERYRVSPTESGSAGHRGLVKIIDGELVAFALAPSGAPADPPSPAEDPERARLRRKYFGDDGHGA
jgi:hypothetical protein